MRNFLLGMAALAVTGVVTLVALELFMRFLPYNSGLVASYVDDTQPVYRFVANAEVRYSQDWDMKNGRIRHVNADGFLSDVEYLTEAKEPLIALIGDSFIEAIQVDWGESVHGRLHRQLSPEIRVYAFGAAFASLAQYLGWATYVGEKFGPEMLVVNVVGNDFLQKLPGPDEAFTGGFQGMHYFAENSDGELVVRRSDRPRESLLRRIARQSALLNYAHRNLSVTAAPGRFMEIISTFFAGEEAPDYIANTFAHVEAAQLELSRRQVDRFLELLPERVGLPPDAILITIDGLRPELYTESLLAANADAFPAQMSRYLEARGSELGFEVVLLEPLFARRHRATGERFEFPFNNHWNANGHAVLANAILESETFRRTFGATVER